MLTPVRLYQGQPDTTEEVLHTVVEQYVIVRKVVLCNTDASAKTITLGLVDEGGVLDAANRVLSGHSIDADVTEIIDLGQVMYQGDEIRALQETSGAITVHISGVVRPRSG